MEKLRDSLDQLKFRQAAGFLRSLWVLGNEYITEQKPWETIKTNPDQAAVCLTHCLHLLRLYALTSYCFMPDTSKKIMEMLNDSTGESIGSRDMSKGLNFSFYDLGHILQPPQRLFAKIEDTAIAELTQQYGGGE